MFTKMADRRGPLRWNFKDKLKKKKKGVRLFFLRLCAVNMRTTEKCDVEFYINHNRLEVVRQEEQTKI